MEVKHLVDETNSTLRAGMETKKAMQRLIGLLAWPCLLRRCILSVLREVYEIANLTDRPAARIPLTPN